MELCQTELNPEYYSDGDGDTLLSRAAKGDEDACRRFMEENAGLVHAVARRFLGRGAEYEDLFQIGSIGMLRAIRTFDASRGCAFSTYAFPLIMGEIRRFLRDDGMIKVTREQKRLGGLLLREREARISRGEAEPGIAELALAVGTSPAEAAEALCAVSPVTMFSEPITEDGATVESTLSDEGESERVFDRIALSEAISHLPPLWRKIVTFRYFRDLSQQKTAELLGLSQVKVSREEKKLLAYLRGQLS